jgi:hypothetical protein
VAGYRVSVESEDSLRVDESLCADQWMKQRMLVHAIASVFTFGMWFPFFIGWLITLGSRRRKFSNGYSVRIDGSQLTVGTAGDSRSIPLDGIGSVAVSSGIVTVSIRGVQAPHQILGLANPTAAARAMLEARDAYVRGLTPASRAQSIEIEDAATAERRASAR